MSGIIITKNGYVRIGQLTQIAAFVMRQLHADGGGTHNLLNGSKDGLRLVAYADVGGTRNIKNVAISDEWGYLPTLGPNINVSRQVAGGCITNDGILFQLVGNGTVPGRVQEINVDTNVGIELVDGLDVRANAITPGDSGSRPRPVGWNVLYDEGIDYLYFCTGAGVGGYDRATSTYDGIIALAGESCRGFAHENHGIINNADVIHVNTRSKGIVRLDDIQGNLTESRVSPDGYARFEDSSIIDGEALLGAAHEQGVLRYDADGYVTTNDLRITADAVIPADIATERYWLMFEGQLDWSTASGTLIGAWGSTNAEQTIRLQLNAGVLRFQLRHAGGIAQLDAAAAFTEGSVRMAVRYRPTSSTSGVLEKKAVGGNWTIMQTGTINEFANGTPVALTVAEAGDGSDSIPATAQFYRAAMTKLGETQPVASIDVTGAIAGIMTATGVAGDTWSWPSGMTINAGSLDVTPSQNVSPAANGGTARWNATAVTDVLGTKMAAVATINPDSASEWIYRALNIETATAGDWDSATPNPSTLNLGSSFQQPANRVQGNDGDTGVNLTGVLSLWFPQSDLTGNTLYSSASLSLFKSSNFAGAAASINWETFNKGLSVLSLTSVQIHDGVICFSASDHNSFVLDADQLYTHEPTRLAHSGVGDGFSIFSVGTGDNKITVFCPSNDADWEKAGHDVLYHKGSGVPTGWTTTGYETAFTGFGPVAANMSPRACGVTGWDNGDGTYTFIVYADGLGFVRSTVTVSTGAWNTWQVQTTGPTTDLITDDQNQERQLVCSSTGSVVIGIQLKTGQLWRSLDQGVNWSAIASSIGTNQDVRTGRIAYIESTDTLAASDGAGLYKILNASAAATVTQITGISDPCILAKDDDGYIYAHENVTGTINLWRFTDFGAANSTADATQIATNEYRNRVGGIATNMTVGDVGGEKTGITIYQGAGAVAWAAPDLEWINEEELRFDPTVLPIPEDGIYHGVSTVYYDTPDSSLMANRLAALADFEQSVYETATNTKRVMLDRQFLRWDNFINGAGDDVHPYLLATAALGRTPVASVNPITAGNVPLVDPSGEGKGTWASIAAGEFDADIINMAQKIRDCGISPFVFCFNHEPEDEVRGNPTDNYMGTAAEYIAAWRQVVTLFRQQQADNVDFMWIMRGRAFGDNVPYDLPNAEDLYPGDDYIDWIAGDVYNYSFNGDWGSLSEVANNFYSWASQRPKPLAFGEWGSREEFFNSSNDGTRKAAWFDEGAQWLKTEGTRVKAIMYFNHFPDDEFGGPDAYGESGPDWRIDTSTKSLEAYRRLAQDPYFIGIDSP